MVWCVISMCMPACTGLCTLALCGVFKRQTHLSFFDLIAWLEHVSFHFHLSLFNSGCNGLNIYYHSKRCTETRYAPVASVVSYSNHCPVHKCNIHWTGDPLTVSVNVVSLPNAPLDLYILMDLSDSMAAPLATVKSISQLIGEVIHV